MEEQEAAPDVGSIFGFSISLVLLGLVFLIAAANAVAALTLFAATTIALMAAVQAWGRLSHSRLSVSLSVERFRLFPGESFELRAEIFNRKLLPVWMRLGLPYSTALTLTTTDGKENSVESETGLMPFERVTGSWTFRAERRGVHRLGPAMVVAGDLLGLYRKEKPLSFKRDIVVFPRLVPISDLALPFRDYFGIHPSKGIIEDPAWYEGTREYSGNKPAKNIHWKASARFDALQEKIFEPTSHRKVFFLLDGNGFLEAEDSAGFEAALEILGSLAARFAETGASFAVATNRAVLDFPAVLPLGRGPEHLGNVLELLARCREEPGSAILPLLGGVGYAGAGFVIIARSPDESTKKFYTLPASRRDRVLFLFAENTTGADVDDRRGYPTASFKDLIGDGALPSGAEEADR